MCGVARVCVRACVRACVRVCVRACVCVCVWTFTLSHVSFQKSALWAQEVGVPPAENPGLSKAPSLPSRIGQKRFHCVLTYDGVRSPRGDPVRLTVGYKIQSPTGYKLSVS